MTMSFSTTPTAEQLRTLPTADLGLIMLKSFQDHPYPNSILRGHEQAHSQNGEPDADFLMQRFSDAWAWLVANGLVGPRHRNTSSDWFRVTQPGRQVGEAGSARELLAEQRLPDDLHPDLGEAQPVLWRER